MRNANPIPQRFQNLRNRGLAGRRPVQIGIGIMAVVAIGLAILLRPGSDTPSAALATSTAKPAATAAAAAPTLAPAPTAIPTPPAEKVHTVAEGDTLMSIAEKYYGDVNKYEKVFEANKDTLKSPDSLQLGQKLKIPN